MKLKCCRRHGIKFIAVFRTPTVRYCRPSHSSDWDGTSVQNRQPCSYEHGAARHHSVISSAYISPRLSSGGVSRLMTAAQIGKKEQMVRFRDTTGNSRTDFADTSRPNVGKKQSRGAPFQSASNSISKIEREGPNESLSVTPQKSGRRSYFGGVPASAVFRR